MHACDVVQAELQDVMQELEELKKMQDRVLENHTSDLE
jgi:hypothetical protein